MKNILKIILITSFTIISYFSFSQKNYNELREIQEIKQIIKYDTSKKLSLFFLKVMMILYVYHCISLQIKDLIAFLKIKFNGKVLFNQKNLI